MLIKLNNIIKKMISILNTVHNIGIFTTCKIRTDKCRTLLFLKSF